MRQPPLEGIEPSQLTLAVRSFPERAAAGFVVCRTYCSANQVDAGLRVRCRRNSVSLDVLLVEDNPGDVRLTMETFRDANKSVRLHLAANGVEAMAFLRRQGPYALAPRPVLILLDLNLPKMDGREVLAEVKSDIDLKTIPIVILTTSEAESDITRSYQLHANCYLTKPVRLEEFETLVKSVNDFWFTKVKLINITSHDGM